VAEEDAVEDGVELNLPLGAGAVDRVRGAANVGERARAEEAGGGKECLRLFGRGGKPRCAERVGEEEERV
jgi:hypothetical protein